MRSPCRNFWAHPKIIWKKKCFMCPSVRLITCKKTNKEKTCVNQKRRRGVVRKSVVTFQFWLKLHSNSEEIFFTAKIWMGFCMNRRKNLPSKKTVDSSTTQVSRRNFFPVNLAIFEVVKTEGENPPNYAMRSKPCCLVQVWGFYDMNPVVMACSLEQTFQSNLILPSSG
jgi:hypothetical protein